MNYTDFLARKAVIHPPTGIPNVGDLHPALFGFQRDCVRWALRRGRAALFEDCGLGKTLQQLVWADEVCRSTGGNVILLAPLAVGQQTVAEAERFGIRAHHSRDGSVRDGITVTNYEQLHRFGGHSFAGVVLDESSILKSYSGAIRNEVIERFADTPFRLACTATPAPNDHMELGNHAEFLGVMSRVEMLATFFVHDGGDTSVWRLKGHAESDFWRWVASWAAMVRKPSDIGHSDAGFALPPMRIHEHILESGVPADGMLFAMPAQTLDEQRRARRATMSQRVAHVASMVNSTPGAWLVWCELNDEGDALRAAISGSVQVSGADSEDAKADRMLGFADGRYRVLITKPSIAGFGMNWQHCHQMAFVGLSHSYEQFYQATRRCWRFGQRSDVDVHVVTTDIESAVLHNIKRKQADADAMAVGMVEHMRAAMDEELHGAIQMRTDMHRGVAKGDTWTMHWGDCVDVLREMPSNSVHYSVFSPPFASLYTYSASDRDMGNCRSHADFYTHFRFAVEQMFRVIKPGRLVSFHCMNLPTTKERDGVIGLADFRGDLIRLFQSCGWVYHSEVTIWKDPVTAMQRTKALGLLHKQLKKDSAMSRQGIPDYLVTMRKPGENPEPVTHTNDDYPVSLWQRVASPVWMDINPSDTLQYRSAREDKDERHICPLQLGVIRRAVELWTNPGDIVLSPFAGIGSEGYVSLEMGRMFVGIELKSSYFEQAVANLRAVSSTRQQSLFGDGAV